jgi:hypothetical protein
MHPHTRRAVRAVHVAHVEADDLRQPQPRAESQGDDQVIAEVRLGGAEDEGLLVGGDGGG